jgi:small-conductance mechanosensitive channel
VAKVVHAILIVVIGYLLVALLTRFATGLAIRRGKLEETSARIARKWILAVTLVILLLLALDVVKIPLTAFAFLGGAIAIGAGFGMQTLLKNLISGVMLLMERPFKPRDIVEVGGIRGEVTDINVRSCTIRDVNGIETLVPNSTFLEQNVTNWTLSSRKVRFVLNIGVGYGSPVRKVSDLLLEVADRHKQVLEDPVPEVLFMDFGDNALMFALYVWLEIGPGRRSGNVILSDLRFMIDASFAEHGIEIPFPQRNVHLDANSPVPVRVVPPEPPQDKLTS